MEPTRATLLGTALIVAGAVLALLLPDLTLFWFTGRPLGILLVAVGAFELGEAYLRRRGQGGSGSLR